ncbi:uncharacterized protein EKO05_0008229 [Ascochyta rabiei]|uniref:uncharacterized protein n=1 Tax=Didymella rabiei TaxID=5454 RepID=UPI0018FF185C|nr:uncharacterized protein EKO05_0008229 [Ascochyta rabiei]UPX17902.1 hypothetical protein EKO05_0008229 [Ascochyta rabiei]
MDLLLSASRDKPLGGAHNALQTGEIQAVMNLVDNMELQKEYFEKVQGMDSNDVSLKDLGNTLHLDSQKHVSDVVAILFRYSHDIQVRGMMDITNRDEASVEGLSDYQEQLVANVMETINQSRLVAVGLLYKSWWNVEVAITRWYESEAPVEPKFNANILTNNIRESDPSLPGSSGLAKRPYEAEAGPSGSKKKPRTTSPDQQSLGSPEEDLSAARARLDRIIAEELAADLKRARNFQQETDKNKNAQGSSEGPKPTLQGKLTVGFEGYSLEALKSMVAAEKTAPVGGLQSKEVSESSKETAPRSSTADQSSNILPEINRRYNLRDRGGNIDYSDVNRKTEMVLQDEVAAAKLSTRMRQQVSGAENNEKKLEKLGQRQSTLPPASKPPSYDQKSVTLWPENTPLGMLNPRSRTPSGRELSTTLLKSLPIPLFNNTFSTIGSSSHLTKASTSHIPDIEGFQAHSKQSWSTEGLDGSGKDSPNNFTPQEIGRLAERYTDLQRQKISQPFLPMTPTKTLISDHLSPGEGMHKALKFPHSGSLTLLPQIMPSIDQLRSTTPSKSTPEVPSPRRGPPATPRDAPDMSPALSLPLQTSRPASPSQPSRPSQPSQPKTSTLDQSPHGSPQAQSKSSGHTIEGVPYSTVPYTFPSSPALRPSSGPSLASDRDLSSLSEYSPPPTTHPDSAVLGHYGAKMNDPLFQDNPASRAPPLDGAEIAVSGTEKVDNWRRDSAQRMSIASATALAQNLLDAEEAAKTASEAQPGVDEEAGRRVRFADDEQIIALGNGGDELGVQDNRTQSMVDEGVGEAECPEEWFEDA